MLTRVNWKVGNCIIRHEPAATASEAAKAVHFPGACCLKAVLVRLDSDFGLCAIPANRCVDLSALAKLAGVQEASLATAVELRERVPAAQVCDLQQDR
jgi:prolyl-tRNA editing enzyme YbaK/EbsC (Cys-tRNA(Pro) deacylase)